MWCSSQPGPALPRDPRAPCCRTMRMKARVAAELRDRDTWRRPASVRAHAHARAHEDSTFESRQGLFVLGPVILSRSRD